MTDLLLTAVGQLDAILRDSSLSPRDMTSYVTMARDYLLTEMSRETDASLAARLARGDLHSLRVLLTTQANCEILQYSYGLGSSQSFFATANQDDAGLKSLLAAMLSGPAFRYRHWRSALTEIELHYEVENYIFASPKVFLVDEERENFLVYTTDLCRVLTKDLEHNASGSGLSRIGKFLSRVRNGVAYSCEGSTLDLAKAKGELITRYVDRLTPGDARHITPGFNAEGPIKVGLLWSDVARRTENIVGVASCATLRDAGFHVTSFVFSKRGVTGFSRSLADEIEMLSDAVIHLDDDAVRGTEIIRNASLDVLIIQNNITWGFSPLIGLCSRRLAPVQAVNFCAVVTTGMPSITTYISGSMSERSAVPQAMYTEKLALLEGSCLIFDDIDYGSAPSLTGRLDRAGLSAAQTVFASGANFYKLHPDLTATWIDILRRAPDSVLVLYPFNPNWDWHYPWSILERRLEAQCAELGVDPSRIIVSGAWSDNEPLRELLAQVDIYLDSFPHSGGLSSLDAIVQGIPIVTLAGEAQRQNQTADLLDMLDLGELIARDHASYIATAVTLAHDPGKWADAKRKLLERWRRGEYFNSRRYADELARLVRDQVPDRPGIAK